MHIAPLTVLNPLACDSFLHFSPYVLCFGASITVALITSHSTWHSNRVSFIWKINSFWRSIKLFISGAELEMKDFSSNCVTIGSENKLGHPNICLVYSNVPALLPLTQQVIWQVKNQAERVFCVITVKNRLSICLRVIIYQKFWCVRGTKGAWKRDSVTSWQEW